MSRPAKKDITRALLQRHGVTFADEIGIAMNGAPASLFQLLVACLLFSQRMRATVAVEAARALRRAGWTTPEKMARAGNRRRTLALRRSGFARFDVRASAMLGELSRDLVGTFHGDLRGLREQAGRDAHQERALLKRFAGIGDTAVDIFFREAQGTWRELAPFADARVLSSAASLGLGRSATALSELVAPKQFPRFVAALVRASLAQDHDAILEAANAGPAGRRRRP